MLFQALLLFHCEVQPVLGQLRGERHGHLLGLRRRGREDTHHHSQALIKAHSIVVVVRGRYEEFICQAR